MKDYYVEPENTHIDNDEWTWAIWETMTNEKIRGDMTEEKAIELCSEMNKDNPEIIEVIDEPANEQ